MSDHPTSNRLARETSPYLLQHSHNPVDWYPWGEEALSRARKEDRPVLLSIGYSACHWCHVMERESFEDPETARVMNDQFVCIKVDREERPDLDHVYQAAIQILGRNGGWPLTMFLTPTLKPFFGGTYFPPVDRHGMRAFRRILEDVGRAYREQRPQVDRQAAEITEYLGKLEAGGGRPTEALSREAVATASKALLSRYDPEFGGFGPQPKFPNSTVLELWLRYARSSGDTSFRDRVAFTLRKMIEGGIYDQIGGGFHRYSTDQRWLVPHFEKMLYDNGLLLRLLAQVMQVTGDSFFARAASDTAHYVRSEMSDLAGGFYATQDADSEGEEGRFFVWDADEIRAVVGEADADLIARVFGVEAGGNFEHGKSILHRPVELAALGRLVGRSESDIEAALARATPLLYAAREKRVHPGRDDKVIAGWNGLMMQGLAALALAGDPQHLEAARRCSQFVADKLWKGGRLQRTWRSGEARIDAFAEDHAFLAEGELALFEATGEGVYFTRARDLVEAGLERFSDPNGGFFVTASDGEALIQRPKATYDNAVPSATSSMTMALLRLHAITGEGRYADVAEKTLRACQAEMAKNPLGYSYMLCALDAATAGMGTLVITGPAHEPAREALLAAARSSYQPNLVVVPWTPDTTPPPELAGLVAGKPGDPAAWLCRNGACSTPARTPDALKALLNG